MSAPTDPIAQMEERARTRFAGWDAALWRELVEGPARQLAGSLASTGSASAVEPLLASYLSLGAEAIGLGYLFPSSRAGVESFFTVAWTKLVPSLLADVPEPQRAAALATCWNLAENLERSPAWLRKIFHRLAGGLSSLVSLEAFVADVSRRCLEAPARLLGPSPKLEWLWPAPDDARFLPGAMHFLAPTVLCVHDRHRTGEGGRDAVTYGLWLDEAGALALGPMGCREQPAATVTLTPENVADLQRRDCRVTERFCDAGNEWRAALGLTTSQAVVALTPG